MRIVTALIALAAGVSQAGAQRQPDSAFVDLRQDGNGLGTLQRPITVGFAGQTARHLTDEFLARRKQPNAGTTETHGTGE